MKNNKIEYMNTNTKNLLEPSYNTFEINEYYKENEAIIHLISLYTRQKEKGLYKELSNVLLKHDYNISFGDIKQNEDSYEYISKDGQIIKFNKLSNRIIDKKMIKELNSIKRRGKCHEKSIILSIAITDSSVLTGYIVIGNYKILHSIVEVKRNDKIEILDYTQNLIMDKEEYIKLFNFTILSKIETKDLVTDIEFLQKTFPNFPLKKYLVFRDELMKDLEKNKFMLEELDKKDRKGR